MVEHQNDDRNAIFILSACKIFDDTKISFKPARKKTSRKRKPAAATLF